MDFPKSIALRKLTEAFQSLLIVSAAIFLITHSTNLQVPLYGTYAESAGYGSGISAIAFASSIAGLLPTWRC